MAARQLMHASGVAGDPYYKFMWSAGLSPLNSGKLAAQAQGQLQHMLVGRALVNQFRPTPARLPIVPVRKAIILGREIATGRPVMIHRNTLTRHMLVVGASGSGKTTLLAWIVHQLIQSSAYIEKQPFTVQFVDHKGEGRRFLHRYRDVTIFRPDQVPWNILEPVGDHETYWYGLFHEIGRAFNLRPETWSEMISIMVRLGRGLPAGNPYPSLLDFECILRILAEKDGRPNLLTAARAMATLNALLGRSARIRKVDKIMKQRLIVYEQIGLPPRPAQCLEGIRHQRILAQASAAGHSQDLNEGIVIDEAGLVLGKELGADAGSGYISPYKRDFNQLRSMGKGLLAGVQVISDIEDCYKANITTLAVLRCPNIKDARECQQMLGLPDEAINEIISLPTGVGYVRSEGFDRAVKAVFPNFDLGRYPSDEEVARHMAPIFQDLAQNTTYSEQERNRQPAISYLEILGEKDPAESVKPDDADVSDIEMLREHELLVMDILNHPNDCVTEHYERLGWSAGRGNRIKNELVENGIIAAERQMSKNGRPREVLVMTEKGRKLFHDAQ